MDETYLLILAAELSAAEESHAAPDTLEAMALAELEQLAAVREWIH